ncbi:sarcosine oxidase subunit beta [Massilia sp. WF1]|uniref:NAD(P)/FAD-dependent oxidoreductase n=1 Tax=unclassified Massilia TaxID=2609279 RepID=UPI00064A5E46|nr:MULTISPECIES: FAD-dependent oxidoreductase [unclassified Massilia]ALK96768.1 sarcosine oxidase subunit beta [Massilia sp. WG5]KLU38111.1 sarcosine oxidase subunit beta [Massilia sp. WF1]
MNQATSDVLIVGGGLMGTATAFFLRRRGVSVTLLERGLVGQQASGVNFGNVRRQARYLAQLPLANRAHGIWQRLPELIGDDIEFLPSGHIRVAYTQDQVGVLEKYARDAREYGLDLELVDGAAMRARYPFLGPEVRAASLSPQDGHANPRLAAPAFARAAVRTGAQIVENTEVLEIAKEGGEFRAACADGRVFRAPVLLIASGAWGNRMSAAFGEPVPLTARGPQMAVTEPVPYRIGPSVGVATPHLHETLYFRQIKRGNIIFGGCGRGPAYPDLRRAYVLPEHTLTQFGQLKRLAPPVARLNIIRVWSGIEGYLDDNLPVLGPSPKVSGLYYAFGFSGHGFQLGPGVGDLMAELIATGGTSTPIAPFGIGRFATSQNDAAALAAAG